MAEGSHLISARNMNQILKPYQSYHKPKSLLQPSHASKIKASSRKNDLPLITRMRPRRARHRLIKISTADGRWPGKWTSDYVFSLRELHLQDLAEDGQKDSEVFINLSVYKHASFGFSVDGRIITSFNRQCSNCGSPFCREIDTTFNVWILPSSRDDPSLQLPEAGDDPSVIYVKPGHEADLDSLIQDTIRLNTSADESCSESCKRSEPMTHYIGAQTGPSIDRRWIRLLELRQAYS